MNNANIAAVDLFCGIGGLTHGLIKAGIPVVAGIDIDQTCEYAYETNNDSNFIEADVINITGEEVLNLYPKKCKKILVGCAPCTPFSSHTQKNKKRHEEDEWKLLYSYSRLVRETNPDVISMENVPAIIRTEVFLDFVEELENLDFHVFWDVIYCPDYGVPQSRKRLILLASKFGPIDIIPPTHNKGEYETVQKYIGNLEKITDGDISINDPLHRCSKLNEMNIKRIKQSKPGGTWKDWDEDLLLPCHKRNTGKTYSSVYGRMVADAVGPTITTQFYNYGTGRFGHPQQDRALSLREGALLQTFPLEYDFVDPDTPVSIKRLGKHIGNAVPVRLGYIIGESIMDHLKGVRKNGG